MTAADIRIIYFTLGVSVLSVLLTLPFALALAWLLARRRWPGKSIVETLVMLPLVMPPVATGLILLRLFGRNGTLGHWLESAGLEIVFTWKAVVLALGVMSFPLMVRSMRTAIEEVPREQEEVASTLGENPWRVFFRITLPLSRRGLISGMMLAFARALGEFGASVMIAGFIPGQTETLSLAIYRSVMNGEDKRATYLLLISVALAYVLVWLAGRLIRPRVK
jgi:molybdate transport system permease protein